jgi:hypothetical protein
MRTERKISAGESLSVLEMACAFNRQRTLRAALNSCRSVLVHA